MPQEEKKVVHPVAIFKESWGFCQQHFQGLARISAVIYLPVLVISVQMQMQILLKMAKPNLVFLLLGLMATFISTWGHLALTLFVNRAAGEGWSAGQSLSGAGKYFWPYIGATILTFLFMAGFWITGGVLAVSAASLLWKINKIIAILLTAAVAIACVSCTVYFMIRWLLYGVLCVTESAGPITALKRSHKLVKGYVNPVIGAYCLLILVYIAGSIPLSVLGATLRVLGAIGGKGNPIMSLIRVIYNTALNIVLIPLWASVSVVLYRKLKEAVEG